MNKQYISPHKLKLNPDNPRTIKDTNFQKLVNSIKEFPEMLEIRPIVVNSDLVVLGGNMRLRACKEAGLKEVPYIIAEFEEIKEREFIIKDNVSGGEWDWEILANEWDAEQLNEWGLEVPESDFIELEPEAYEDNFNIPDEVETDIVPGDIFEIGIHRLRCGDSTLTDEWEKIFKGEEADLVITDPPYNVDYEGGTGMKIMNDKMGNDAFYQFLYDFYTALGSFTKAGGAWYVWHADSEGVNFRSAFQESGLLLKQCLIWVKNSMVLGRQDYQWKHEPCIYGWKPGAGHYFVPERDKTTVIEDKVDIKKLTKAEMAEMLTKMLSDKIPTSILSADKPHRSELHPTMKPVLLISQLVQNSSKPGELIADGFLGSGSTMVAAHQLGRKCYGMELDPKYCQVIIDRMRKLDPTLEIKRNGQPYETDE